ncbi:MAG: hypothetical protein AAF206_28380, partial [Bacteroidota bacterium]
MRRFILHIIGFFALLLVINLSIEAILPYYWGNLGWRAKINYLEENQFDAEVYFVGSSRTYRHLVPEVFENLTGQKAFNLGYAASFTPEPEYLLGELMKSGQIDGKTVFLELQMLNPLPDQNVHTRQSRYFQQWRQLPDTYRIISESSWSDSLKRNSQHNYLVANVEKIWKLGMYKEIISFMRQGKGQNASLGPNRDGYLSFNTQLSQEKPAELQKRRQFFLDHPESLTERKKIASQAYSQLPNEAFVHDLAKLFALAAEHQIELVLFLPPRLTEAHFKA